MSGAPPQRCFPRIVIGTTLAFVVLFVYLSIRQQLGLRVGSKGGTYLQSLASTAA
jgi:hypothetical protein